MLTRVCNLFWKKNIDSRGWVVGTAPPLISFNKSYINVLSPFSIECTHTHANSFPTFTFTCMYTPEYLNIIYLYIYADVRCIPCAPSLTHSDSETPKKKVVRDWGVRVYNLNLYPGEYHVQRRKNPAAGSPGHHWRWYVTLITHLRDIDDSSTSLLVNSRTLMGCTDPLRMKGGVGRTAISVRLGSVPSHLIMLTFAHSDDAS